MFVIYLVSPSACSVLTPSSYLLLTDMFLNLCLNITWKVNLAYSVMYVIVTYHVLLVVRNNVKPLAIKTYESCLYIRPI
jgi:hypothetical protein